MATVLMTEAEADLRFHQQTPDQGRDSTSQSDNDEANSDTYTQVMKNSRPSIQALGTTWTCILKILMTPTNYTDKTTCVCPFKYYNCS